MRHLLLPGAIIAFMFWSAARMAALPRIAGAYPDEFRQTMSSVTWARTPSTSCCFQAAMIASSTG